MSRPHVDVDVAAIEANARTIVELCAGHGIEVMGVTKGAFGLPEVAAAMVRGGVSSLGDSRLEHLEGLRAAGLGVPLALLRPPSWADVERVVDTVDLTFQTELATIERLGSAAGAIGRVHDVIVMVDLGDRREGILPEAMPALTDRVEETPGIRLVGVATNLSCFTGLAPTQENMGQLVELAEAVERRHGRRLTWVSGGSSSALELLSSGAMPSRIDQLRVGEAILLGRETLHHRPWPGTVPNAFVLRGEVVEVRHRPPAPEGLRGDRAFARASEPAGEAGLRALVAVGRADVDVEGLTPLDLGHRILGGTSDYLVVDVSDAEQPVAVGDVASYRLDYGALVSAMGSRSVDVLLGRDGERAHS